MTIWTFQRRLSARLTTWAVVSIVAGALGAFNADRRIRGIASQAVGWGAINLLIAIVGTFASGRRRESLPAPDAPDVLTKETVNLRRLLWLNAGLDLLYMIGGAWATLRGERQGGDRGRQLSGTGLGIILQGAFLFAFDVYHAARLDPNAAAATDEDETTHL